MTDLVNRNFRPVGAGLVISLSILFGVGAFAICSTFAAEWDDCGTRPTNKSELACTAIVNDGARSEADHARAYTNRARAYLDDAKLDLALSDTESALRLDDRSVAALLIRGLVSQRRNAFDAARADFDRAIDLNPNNVGGFL